MTMTLHRTPAGPHGDRVASEPPRAAQVRLASAIGLLLVTVYLITMGGHTSSPDEEGMFYVAQSIVEQHNFVVPDEAISTTTTLRRGVDGHYYEGHGLATSIMLVPFLSLGELITPEFPISYSGMLLRLFGNLLDPIITALTACCVFAICRYLRYGYPIPALLALAFGLATIAWPYSKYLWSEPVTALWLNLSVLLVMVAKNETNISRLVAVDFLAGICLGLATMSKITTVIAVIGFGAYYTVEIGRKLKTGSKSRRFQRVVLYPIAFASGLSVCLILIGIYNFIRFGNPLDIGYPSVPFGLEYGGIQGLLLSPDKSVFVYTPIALLFIPGIWKLQRTHVAEAALISCIVLTHIILYGTFRDWPGDAAWGPRYLVPVTSLLVVPVGSLLQGTRKRLARVALGLTVAVGVLVQLGGVLVNYDAPWVIRLAQVPRDDRGQCCDLARVQRYQPLESPVVQHLTFAATRLRDWQNARLGAVELGPGLYASEGPGGQAFPRWTDGEGTFLIRESDSAALDITLTYVEFRPPPLGPAVVKFFVDDEEVPRADVKSMDGAQASVKTAQVKILRKDNGSSTTKFTIFSNSFIPAQVLPSDDYRQLGTKITGFEVREGSTVLPLREPLIYALPLKPGEQWSSDMFVWFYDPRNEHLIDSWLWYIFNSGIGTYIAWGREFLFIVGATMIALFVFALHGIISNWNASQNRSCGRTACTGSCSAG